MTTHPVLTRLALLLAAIALLMTGALLYAGPPDPPAGPVTGTYKTLTEVEPRVAINATNTPGDADSLFKITQPGSYYLQGNITGAIGKHGIEIAAPGVTLDLAGFDLVGVPAMGSFDAVTVSLPTLTNLAVLNGSIRGWGGDGLDLLSNNPANSRVERVHSSGNVGSGITLGVGGLIRDCLVASNSQHGLFVSTGTITNCTVTSNTGNGINAGNGCNITDCTVSLNSTGISTGSACTVSNCTVYDNQGHGIICSSGAFVTDCSVRSNRFDGIQCSSNSVIRANSCDSNGDGSDGAGIHATGLENHIQANDCTNADRGIDVDGSRNIITRNTCSGNATNWDIAGANVILVINAVSAGPFSGNFGGVSPGSNDPMANFTH